jgi:hypothetical protein
METAEPHVPKGMPLMDCALIVQLESIGMVLNVHSDALGEEHGILIQAYANALLSFPGMVRPAFPVLRGKFGT